MTSAGKRIRILVATTRGPVAVTHIRPEHPSVRSVVCVAGSLSSLPVSADYDAFVRRPTGVVERFTGHPVYRTDISAPIESGDSWQLGLFLAHVLKHEGFLAEEGEPADLRVLVTGRLNRDLDVGAVDHVAEKLARAVLMEDGGGLFLYPADGDRPEEIDGWDCRPVAGAADALSACLGAERAKQLLGSASQAAGEGLRPGKLRFAAVLVLCCLIGGGVALLQLQDPGLWRPSGQGREAQSIMALEIIPRDEEGCGAPLKMAPDAHSFDGLACAAIVTIRRDGEFRIAMSVSGSFLDYAVPERYRLDHHGYASGGDWLVRRIDFPYWVRRPMVLEAEVTQLAEDGSRLLTARRSIELRP